VAQLRRDKPQPDATVDPPGDLMADMQNGYRHPDGSFPTIGTGTQR
jgi:hypothetical protein